jgi:hypothetical protein
MRLSTYVDGRQKAGKYLYLRCGDGFGVYAACNTAGIGLGYETRTRTYLLMETRIGSNKSQTQDFACNWHSTHKIRPTQQARSLDGDEVVAQ